MHFEGVPASYFNTFKLCPDKEVLGPASQSLGPTFIPCCTITGTCVMEKVLRILKLKEYLTSNWYDVWNSDNNVKA